MQLVCFQARHRGEQAGLPRLVRPRPDLRDPQDAVLLFVLLSEGSPAQAQRLAHAGRARGKLRKAVAAGGSQEVLLESVLRGRRREDGSPEVGKAPRAADGVGRRGQVLHALHPGHLLLWGAAGARGGEHGAALPGSVLLQEQAVRRGVALRAALLRLQRRESTPPPGLGLGLGLVLVLGLGLVLVLGLGLGLGLGLVLGLGPRGGEGSPEADLAGPGSDGDAVGGSVRAAVGRQHAGEEGVAPQPHRLHALTRRPPIGWL
ncbi:hypothetical protein EYF80_060521 [Liparis tanakae]|uniref:Uncharacterized protein n=1 Tax=Liparis tanakae TaxID=230148 RepID=A0A4Z2ELW1_9TELE|nr:hypothetical protein EYF80_060521 [Liparis tanakae]